MIIILIILISAIISVFFVGEVAKRVFHVLPDSQNALLSANSFLKLLSQQTIVENVKKDGITLVS